MPLAADRPEEDAKAAELRQLLRLGYGRIDPFAVARELGLEVYRYPVRSANGLDGQYRPLPDGAGAIFVNSATGNLRQRFTAAHEIGHFVLHRDQVAIDVDLFSQANVRSPIERQTDRFAGALLIDETAARQIWGQSATLDEAVCALIDEFEVSVPTAAIQLRNLECISPGELTGFLGRHVSHGDLMRANGRKSRHREGDGEVELDPDFRKAVAEMLAAAQLGPEQAAEMLECAVEELPTDALAAYRAIVDADDFWTDPE